MVHTCALPYYQPIIGGKGGTPSYEVLGRLLFEGKVLTPAEFFPTLERADAMKDYDWALLPLVIEQMGVWKETLGSIRVHVNACPEILRSRGYLHLMRDAFRTYDVFPNNLTIEIVENTAFWESWEMLEVITELRALGVGIAIDDVPSWEHLGKLLAWLKDERIGVQTMKIDHRFVRLVCDEGTNGAATTEFLRYAEFAHARGMKLIVEGIETEQDLFRMDILGADEFQGNGIGEPGVAASVYQDFVNHKVTEHSEPHGAVRRLRHKRNACVL